MCPVCLTSLAVTLTTTTGVGAAALAVATRVARSLARPHAAETALPAPTEPTDGTRGGR